MSSRFAALLVVAFVVGGCSSSSDNIGPTDPTSGNGNPLPPAGGGDFVPLFRPTSGVLPFPIDLYFSGSTDGTLNLPASLSALTPHFAALNALDGFSTTADITLRFSAAIDPATLAANVRVFRQAAERVDVIVATGGLGPTADDLTRQALAEAAGVPLVLDEPSLAHIRGLFARRQRPMPESNVVQAMFPAGSRPVASTLRCGAIAQSVRAHP